MPVTPRGRGQLRRQGDGRDGSGREPGPSHRDKGVVRLDVPRLLFLFPISILFPWPDLGRRGDQIGRQHEPCTQTNHPSMGGESRSRSRVSRCAALRLWRLPYLHQSLARAFVFPPGPVRGALLRATWRWRALWAGRAVLGAGSPWTRTDEGGGGGGGGGPSNDSVPDLSTVSRSHMRWIMGEGR